MPTHKYKRGVYAAMMLVALEAMSGCDNANSASASSSGHTEQEGRGNEVARIPPSSGIANMSTEVAPQVVPVSFHASHAEVRHFEAYSRYRMMFDDAADGPTTVTNSSSIERSLDIGTEGFTERFFAGAGAIGACLASTRHEQGQEQD